MTSNETSVTNLEISLANGGGVLLRPFNLLSATAVEAQVVVVETTTALAASSPDKAGVIQRLSRYQV
jgi:hypothetical protein